MANKHKSSKHNVDTGVVVGNIQPRSKLTKKQALIILVAFAAITLGVTGFLLYRGRNSKERTLVAPDYPDSGPQLVEQFKEAKTNEEKPVLITAYLINKEYDKAKDLAIELAKSTSSVTDWQSALTICANNPVSQKDDCLKTVDTASLALVSKMSFTVAYSFGSQLEVADKKKQSLPYYERALSVYDANLADEFTLKKDDLAKHIAELKR
jgi:hypothetical protein